MKNLWSVFLLTSAFSISLMACGEDTGTPVAPGTMPEAEEGLAEESDEPIPVSLDNEEEFGQYIQEEGYIEEGSITFVMSSLSFDLQPEEGISSGFNLDSKVSDETDEASCGHVDQISEDGEEGIDNKIANIFWIFKDLYGPPINDLLSNAIQEGRLLVMMELLNVDDLENDDDVTLRWYRGAAVPQVGISGDLLSSQTYYVDDTMEKTVAEAYIEDGILYAGPFNYGVPLEIFDANIVVNIVDGQLRLNLNGEDGKHQGMLGGSVEFKPLLEELYQTGASSEAQVVTPYIEQEADTLPQDGLCLGLSMGAGIVAVEGFLVHYP